MLRADSAYYGHDVIAAVLCQRARFSITARQDKAIRAAIATIEADAWTAIKYIDAVFDQDQQTLDLRRGGRRDQLPSVHP